MSEEIVEKAISEVVKNLSFKQKLWETIKFILIILTIVILIFKFLKWGANNVRLAWKLQLGDDTWGTIVWIKLWWLIFGIVAVYLWNVEISTWDWIQSYLVWIEDAWKIITDVIG